LIRNLAREARKSLPPGSNPGVEAQRRVRVIGPPTTPSPEAARAPRPSASRPSPAPPGTFIATVIRDHALTLGFDAVGFCRAELGPEARQRLAAFLAAGQHGDMGWLAARAGLGWQGKHTNLVSHAHGSWLFLGEIYTTLDIPPEEQHADRCGTCARCLSVCPTDAFPAPYRLDATRCISYLTIEHAGPIPLELRPLLGNRIYGCDDCLAVCPWNRFARATPHPKLRAREDLTAPRLAELAALDDAGFRAMFGGSPIKRIGRDRFVRNVLMAMGNSGETSLLPVVQRLRSDPNPVVADAAAWACERLGAPA
jgi:epoxyqueuosine reductase QueG